MTMQAHLEYFADLKGVARSRVDELLEALGLSHVRRNRMNQCSRGSGSASVLRRRFWLSPES